MQHHCEFLKGDALAILRTLPDESVDCCVTSPPYWGLRDYGVGGQLGLEPDFRDYITKLCDIFDEVKRVLKTDGTCWVNLGDSYFGSGKGNGDESDDPKYTAKARSRNLQKAAGQPKCLAQIPSRFAIEMTDRGWILRNEIIWHKPNAMPSSVRDRFMVDFEKMLFFVKSRKYYFETQREPHQTAVFTARQDGVRATKFKQARSGDGLRYPVRYNNPLGRIKRCVWKIATKQYREAHFATFPPELIEAPIRAGCPPFGTVLDPFMGSGTTAEVALRQDKQFIGIELNPNYIRIARNRIRHLPILLPLAS